MAENDDLIVIHRPKDVVAANMIRGVLENAGIEVFLKSLQMPMYDDIMQTSLGYWGEVLVRKKDADEAGRIVKQYLSVLEDGKEQNKQ